jgi:hypothetical protein
MAAKKKTKAKPKKKRANKKKVAKRPATKKRKKKKAGPRTTLQKIEDNMFHRRFLGAMSCDKLEGTVDQIIGTLTTLKEKHKDTPDFYLEHSGGWAAKLHFYIYAPRNGKPKNT